ncbi:tyrosine-type recombinase/integrase [Planococcus sp. ISL-109]|uniref:tyrosine-type recombinase/integrase n=1 Tax=Planococcus sp. ISL-109 TaxID=2819166 RepID=UPI0020361AA7|nr:tyrosine-type recombinase/integrase [Planococcus sp. ISL-109]
MLHCLPIRAKAICLVNLVTANRPSEMVRLKISDFDLNNKCVHVYLKKQKRWHTKRLTQEVTQAIDGYIREYHLKPDNYFVGGCIRMDAMKAQPSVKSGTIVFCSVGRGLPGTTSGKAKW